jgi:hypothetical protein
VTSTAIPLGDARALRRFATRTRLVRIGLAVAILTLGVLAVLFARTPANRNGPVLPAGSDGVVVLDLSASTSASEYAEINRYLTELIKSNGRFGLVLFSDKAYEALPPNAPASALATLAPYFQPPYPTSPWAAGFSFGTSISQGLDLAHNVLDGDGVKRRDVWLISDLSDSVKDRPLLNRSLRSYLASGIALHVLPIAPRPRDLAQYRRLFGTQSPTIRVRPLPAAPPRSSSYAFPIALAVVALLVAVALGINELVSPTLRWGRRAAEGVT